jgi:hypothetical protein
MIGGFSRENASVPLLAFSLTPPFPSMQSAPVKKVAEVADSIDGSGFL